MAGVSKARELREAGSEVGKNLLYLEMSSLEVTTWSCKTPKQDSLVEEIEKTWELSKAFMQSRQSRHLQFQSSVKTCEHTSNFREPCLSESSTVLHILVVPTSTCIPLYWISILTKLISLHRSLRVERRHPFWQISGRGFTRCSLEK